MPWGLNVVRGNNGRVVFAKLQLGRLYMHMFNGGHQHHPETFMSWRWHDHGGDFWTFPLRSYVQDVYDHETKTIRQDITPAFRVTHRAAEYLHSNIRPASGHWPIITVLWTGKGRHQWHMWKATGNGTELAHE